MADARLKVLTHSLPLHADESFAVAALGMAHGSMDALEIRRSRKTEEQAWADVVVDVGGRYDPEGASGKVWLDHHQPGGAGTRPDGVPYAAFGLTWKKYGHAAVRKMLETLRSTADDDAVDWVVARVDRTLVSPVDAADCGYSLATGWREDTKARPYSVSAAISACNPLWDDGDPNFKDYASEEAMVVASDILFREVAAAAAAYRAYAPVKAAYADRLDSRLLILEKGMPWASPLLEDLADEEVLYVLFPQADTGWMVQAVPPKVGEFGQRHPLPSLWAGYRGKDIQELSGVPDAVFCHPGRFICGAVSKEGAMSMARAALDAKV